jgi:hypothetical protein
LFATLSTSALFSSVAIIVDTLSDDEESIESIQSSQDILSSIFFVIRESISSGLHPGYTVTTVTIHRLISGKDSFGMRYAAKDQISITSTNSRTVVLRCLTQNQKKPLDNFDFAFISCSFSFIIKNLFKNQKISFYYAFFPFTCK